MEMARGRLWECANHGDVPGLHKLLTAGADVEDVGYDGSTALQTASFTGHAEAAQVLLDAGAKPSVGVLAALGKTARLVEVLEDRPDLVNCMVGGPTPLYWASCFGHIDCVTYLLAKGADPNKIDIKGNEPMLQACWKGHVAIAAMLALAGADLTVKDPRSRMSLSELAASTHNLQLVAMLAWVSRIRSAETIDDG